MTKTCGSVALLLLMFAAATNGETIIELRSAGEHKALADDTPDSARQRALVDARRKATAAVVARLRRLEAIKTLRLTPLQLEAFTSALLELEELPAAARA